MRKLLIIIGVLAAAVAVTLSAPVKAGAADPGHATITFDDAAKTVSLTIPTPCDRTVGDSTSCEWVLATNVVEDGSKLPLVAGSRAGQVLTAAYPPICGTLQADALVGGRLEVGHQHAITNCAPPPTTTTTVPPVTTTTTTVPTPTATTNPPPPTTGPPVSSPPAATQPVTGTLQPAPAPPMTPTAAKIPVLPHTGAPVGGLLAAGLSLVGLGYVLLRRRKVA